LIGYIYQAVLLLGGEIIMGKEQVEIYTVKPDNSKGTMWYPRDGIETGEELNALQVRRLLQEAQFR
jgi:hypothetical protein